MEKKHKKPPTYFPTYFVRSYILLFFTASTGGLQPRIAVKCMKRLPLSQKRKYGACWNDATITHYNDPVRYITFHFVKKNVPWYGQLIHIIVKEPGSDFGFGLRKFRVPPKHYIFWMLRWSWFPPVTRVIPIHIFVSHLREGYSCCRYNCFTDHQIRAPFWYRPFYSVSTFSLWLAGAIGIIGHLSTCKCD